MIARLRFYGSIEEAWTEWDHLRLPRILEDEAELFTKGFSFLEGADPLELETFRSDVEDLGGKAFRCDTSVTRLLLVGPRDMFTELCFISSPLGSLVGRAFRNCMQTKPLTIDLASSEVVLDRTLVMGIINLTPDSFSGDGLHRDVEKALRRAKSMEMAGADIIDVGGESTRPYSDPLSPQDEMERVIPVIERLSNEIGIPISIDTRRAEVARRALESGASMVNDVSGLRDPEMSSVIRDWAVPVVVMHMRGDPKTMQEHIHYDDVVGDILAYFQDRLDHAEGRGIDPRRVILDPGIGFGKTVQNNLDIIRRLREFRSMGHPLLIGPSRKSFIGKVLDLPVEERLEGTLAAVVASAINGADIVRVHDVKEAARALRIVDAMSSW